MRFIGTVDLFGTLVTTTADLDLSAGQGGACTFHEKVADQVVRFSDGFVRQLRDQGATQREVQAQQAQANADAKLVIGRELACDLPPANITSLLRKWKVGDSSTDDLPAAKCTGTLRSGSTEWEREI